MYMILFVLNDPDRLHEILESWDEAGVMGVTIFPSTGMGKLIKGDLLREDLPLIPNLEELMRIPEKTNRTLFTLVPDDAMVDKIVEATERVVGDLDEPNTGVLSVIPVARNYGINRKD